jgi:hypothetical protein
LGWAEVAAYVAVQKPKALTQPLFYTQRSDRFIANMLTHIVNGIYKALALVAQRLKAADERD